MAKEKKQLWSGEVGRRTEGKKVEKSIEFTMYLLSWLFKM